MKKQSDTFKNKIFELQGNSVLAWLWSIRGLLAASRLIDNNAKKIKNANPFERGNRALPISFWALDSSFMLKGFAIECFFKAIWLSMGNKLIANGKYIGIPGTNQHNLTEISKKIGLKIFDESEEKFIDTLTKYLIVYGRYPIPKFPERKRKKYIPDNHFEVFEEIIKKIAKEITKYPAFNKKDDLYLKAIIGFVSK